ncbi:hypothetical protein KZZ52_24075 [Dactylosporangium sp. AC04546]|uniref:hypothetical protein n=1 Tax=Dactylosporangium sp. AC04546 TaxID=2862460 RepID=UPI001EDD80FD|nr:hypothetical protein [Dactylosporangium sp. AC04546]WVK88354.1 hypothetical protein KZZ52_24075 [Dactylosporangium sp. AC04546]
MDRDVFIARFAAAAQAAWVLGQEYIAEELPPQLRFRVRLNQSYDGHPPQAGEVRYPQDSAHHRAVALNKVDAQTVVAELWRNGRVPEWVNLSVVGETGAATVIEVVCCGRFTNDDTRLYHTGEGTPPFHVLGPALPPQHDGARFSIHRRAECWDRSDALHLAAAADKIWSFDLRTDVFDDHLLAALPQMRNVEIFEHRVCTLASNGVSAFARFPNLRTLRLHLTAPDDFRVDGGGSPLHTLTDLTITDLPSRPWGYGTLADIAPAVTTINLSAAGDLWLDGTAGPAVRNITLTAARLGEPTRLPASLDRLDIHLTHGTDHEVATLLSSVTSVRSLSLRGTPVTDAIIPVLERYDLGRLDLVGTATTPPGLAPFRDNHPEVELYPRTPPRRAAAETSYDQL